MAEGTIFDAARQGDVRFLRRWVDTDGDLDRRYRATAECVYITAMAR